MNKRHIAAATAAAFSLFAYARDMPIQNGRLVNALNANNNMITNLPPEFWEGHTGGGGADTNAVRSLIDASFVGGTNAVNTALGSYVTKDVTNGLCTVAAAQAMTNAVMTDANGKFLKTTNEEYGSSISWASGGLKISGDEAWFMVGNYLGTSAGGTKVYGWDFLFDRNDESLQSALDEKADTDDVYTKAQADATFVKSVTTNGVPVPAASGVVNLLIPQGGGGSGGANTNEVNDLIRSYDATNLTARINDKRGLLDLDVYKSVYSAFKRNDGVVYNFYSHTGNNVRWVKSGGEPLEDFLDIHTTDHVYFDCTYRDPETEEFRSKLTDTDGFLFIDFGGGITFTRTSVTHPEKDGTNTLCTLAAAQAMTNAVKNYADTTLRNKTDNICHTNEYLEWKVQNVVFHKTFTDAEKAEITAILKAPNAVTLAYGLYGLGSWDIQTRPNLYQFDLWSENWIGKEEDPLKTFTSNIVVTAYIDDQDEHPHDDRYIDITFERKRAATASKPFATFDNVPSLSGRVYDFAHGSNFTKRVYAALTNVIQTLGGTVTNPPNFN